MHVRRRSVRGSAQVGGGLAVQCRAAPIHRSVGRGASVAVVSVPGDHAGLEAHKALRTTPRSSPASAAGPSSQRATGVSAPSMNGPGRRPCDSVRYPARSPTTPPRPRLALIEETSSTIARGQGAGAPSSGATGLTALVWRTGLRIRSAPAGSFRRFSVWRRRRNGVVRSSDAVASALCQPGRPVRSVRSDVGPRLVGSPARCGEAGGPRRRSPVRGRPGSARDITESGSWE
jgi:hypothetical protein